MASQLSGTIVLHGDVLDPEILAEAGVAATDTILAVTDDDETNILASLLAKRHGARRAITLLNKSTYEPLMASLGIDVVVSPRNITASTILQHVRRGRIHAVHTLREGFGELIEAEALETSSLVGAPLRDIDLPAGVMIGAIVRGKQANQLGPGMPARTDNSDGPHLHAAHSARESRVGWRDRQCSTHCSMAANLSIPYQNTFHCSILMHPSDSA